MKNGFKVIKNHQRKFKHKYKVTPDVYKRLEKIAKSLAIFQRRDDKGGLMFRRHTQFLGRRFDEKTKKWMNDIKVMKLPIMVNHMVNLHQIYQVDGDHGVNLYVDFFNKEAQDQANQEKLRGKQDNNTEGPQP